MNWPNDADGDVLRRLESGNFDFSKEYPVDFNVDFENWPPSQEAIKTLESKYGAIEVVEPDEDYYGYITFQLISKVDYAFVVNTQDEVSNLMESHGGWCESWGVFRD